MVYLVNEYTEFQTMERNLVPLFWNKDELTYDLVLYYLSHRITEEAFDYMQAVVNAGHKITIILPETSIKLEVSDKDSLYAFVDYLSAAYDV
jgi:hypothetical protein